MQSPGDYNEQLAQTALKEEVATQAAADVAKSDDATEPSSAERWMANLKAVKLSEEDALGLLDTMLEKGYWAREYKLFRGKVRVVFRTRDALHYERVTTAINRLANPLDTVVSQTVLRLNLVGSLAEYQTIKLRHPPVNAPADEIDQAFQSRVEFVRGLPAPVIPALYELLGTFDGLVAAALSEGAAQGF
jgi:hypothetical protein